MFYFTCQLIHWFVFIFMFCTARHCVPTRTMIVCTKYIFLFIAIPINTIVAIPVFYFVTDLVNNRLHIISFVLLFWSRHQIGPISPYHWAYLTIPLLSRKSLTPSLKNTTPCTISICCLVLKTQQQINAVKFVFLHFHFLFSFC